MAEVSGTNSTTSSSAAGVLTNPGSALDSDAFMKLLLAELRYQDPTSPMETDKMISQTADLTVVETQQKIADAIDDMANKFTASNSFSLVNTVGKIADTGFNTINTDGNRGSYDFQLYFGKDYLAGNVTITDSNGKIHRNFPLEEGTEGTKSFTWDGTDDNGNLVPAGAYTIQSIYATDGGKNEVTTMGEFKVESVRFNGSGDPELKLGDRYLTIDAIKEIKEAV